MKEIILTQGKVALVDDADYEGLSKHDWYAIKSGSKFYAVRQVAVGPYKQRTIRMHRQLMGCPEAMEVDHENGDGLANWRDNLRVCTHAQNQAASKTKRAGTSSRFRGVSWYKRGKCWHAQIKFEGKQIFLGYFKVEEDAARAYDRASPQFFGEFAQFNFPVTP